MYDLDPIITVSWDHTYCTGNIPEYDHVIMHAEWVCTGNSPNYYPVTVTAARLLTRDPVCCTGTYCDSACFTGTYCDHACCTGTSRVLAVNPFNSISPNTLMW